MVILLLFFLIFVLIKKELKFNNQTEKSIFIFCTFISCILAIPYRTYLISVGYKYGLANLDMQYYVDLAERIKDLGIQEGFDTISNHWNFAQVNAVQIWGYRFYIYFLVVSLFKWTFFSTEISIFFVSIWQLLLAAYSVLKIFNSIKDDFIKYKNISLFMMLFAPPIWYGCVRLLREAFMLFCMAIIISSVYRKDRKWIFRIILSNVVLVVLRPYYAVFMCPLVLMLDKKEKLSLAVEGGIFCVLALICAVMGVGLKTIVSVVLSPNFFNQVKYAWLDPIGASAANGQIPIIIFVGSIWNIIMIIYASFALANFKKISRMCWCSIGLILDICMVYAIAFGGTTELRHKMFFVIPFIILLNNGKLHFSINRKNGHGEMAKSSFLIGFCVVMALIIYFLIAGLIL